MESAPGRAQYIPPGFEVSSDYSGPISPLQLLREQAAIASRGIEYCWWHHPVQIDFDLPSEEYPVDQLQSDLFHNLERSLKEVGITPNHQPNKNSDFILAYYDTPLTGEDLMATVPEVEPPMIVAAAHKYKEGDVDLDTFSKNYTVVVTISSDIAKMKKRQAETITRMLMARLGALKIIMIHPEVDGQADYYALGTMEGGLAIEDAKIEGAIERLRDRLRTHACAKESGKYEKAKEVISKDQWNQSQIPDNIALTSRTLASWGMIDKPFDLQQVCSDRRTRFINRIMGWSRQSESAIAAYAYDINPPTEYQMGPANGVIVSSISGRFGADKTQLKREETCPVAIVPITGYQIDSTKPISLQGFDRYSLGIIGQEKVQGPSIEFDEMSAAILNSGLVRVRRNEENNGFIIDSDGDIFLPRVRGFVHIHQGVDQILTDKNYWGVSATSLVEYVPANFTDYPYPVGCGKDIMFACSTDAAHRSYGVTHTGSGVQVVLFDALDHGTNVLLLSEPVPGTDFIPDNPFETFLTLVDKDSGAVKFTDELAMV